MALAAALTLTACSPSGAAPSAATAPPLIAETADPPPITETTAPPQPQAALNAGPTLPPTPEPFVYQFRPHVLSQEYRQLYGAEVERAFYDYCDAVLAGEETFPCPDGETLRRCVSLSRSCLPIADALLERDRCRVEGGTAHLTYRVSREEVRELATRFREKVTAVITAAVPYREPDWVQAAELLTAVARKDTYDDTATLDDMLRVTPYRAIMEDIGICQELAGEYIYYLLQVGIDAFPVSALNRDGSDAHEWAMAALGGAYYHIDPTYSVSYPDSLYFFGMNDRQREYYGDFPPESFTYADSDALGQAEYAADSRRFEPLWLAESYILDHRKGVLTVTQIRDGGTASYRFEEL